MRLVPVIAVGALVAGVLVAPVAAVRSGAESAQAATSIRADDPEVTFLVGLPRDSEALQAAAQERSTPGNLLYRDHPSLVNAGRSYGAKSRAITRLRNAAKPLGIDVEIDKGRIVARLTATVSEWERAYGMAMRITPASADYPFDQFAFTEGRAYAGPPAALRQVVQEMTALAAVYDVAADTPGASAQQTRELQATLADPGSPQRWPGNLGTLPPGTCDAPALAQKAVYAPGQLQQAYGTTALVGRGVRGEGARLTLISFGGGYVARDIEAAAECFGYAQPEIDVVTGTGVPEPFVNATIETHLDLITASSVLSRAERITLLQVPDTAVAFTDAFARMLDGPAVPDAVSISYGICELDMASFPKAVPLNEDLLRMAAIVGTTVVVATGDNGTSMCGAEVAAETGEPTLWYPATSPWVTAVSGTRLALRPDNTRRTERVWNDLPYVGSAVPAPAGAGGPSGIFDRPWWQPGPTPTGPRAIPDVAVLGAIKPGWPVAYSGGIYSIGGTSGGTPFVAANLAAMSARQRDRGFPTIGFANGWLYQATSARTPAFFDITSGSNAVQLVGCCSAYRGYDMASGLGAPIMDGLYATLPKPAG